MQHINSDLRHLNVDILVYGYPQLYENRYSDDARNFFTRLYLVTDGRGYLRTDTEVFKCSRETFISFPQNMTLVASAQGF